VLAKNCLLDRIIREVEQDEWARVNLRGGFPEQRARKALNAVITELTGVEFLRNNAAWARTRADRVDPTSMNPYDAQLEAEAFEAEKELERAEELVQRLEKLWATLEPLIEEFNWAKRLSYRGEGHLPEHYELPTVKSRMEWREKQQVARKLQKAEELSASVAETEARFFGGAA
jgi:exonuclease VII small subunit